MNRREMSAGVVTLGIALGAKARIAEAASVCVTGGGEADACEAAANDLGEAIVWLNRGGERPSQDDPQVALVTQGIFRALCFLRDGGAA